MDDPTQNDPSILPVDAQMDLDVTSDNAPADGQSVNIAQARLSTADAAVQNVVLEFKITKGSAVFASNHQQTCQVTSNIANAAAADFISTVPETGAINVYPYLNPNNPLTRKTKTYSFAQAGPKPKIVLTRNTVSGILANGTVNNRLFVAVLTDSGALVPNQQVKLEASVPATTFNGASGPFSITTGPVGEAQNVLVALRSVTDVDVTITATLATDNTVKATIVFPFIVPTAVAKTIRLSKDHNYPVPIPPDREAGNTVRAAILDGSGNRIGNDVLQFSIETTDASALFPGGVNRSISYTNTVNDAAETAFYLSKTPNTVTVRCTSLYYPSVTNTIDLEFILPTSPLPPAPPTPPTSQSKLYLSFADLLPGQRSPYACRLLVLAASGYATAGGLIIKSDDGIIFAYTDGNEYNAPSNPSSNTWPFDLGQRFIVANKDNSNNVTRNIEITDGGTTIWKGKINITTYIAIEDPK